MSLRAPRALFNVRNLRGTIRFTVGLPNER